MATGKVKWFNNAKGYGFILPENGESDLFVHYSSIEMDGYKTLKAGQDVDFDMQEGPKGYHAVNIRAHDDGSEDGSEDAGPSEPEVTIDGVDARVEISLDVPGKDVPGKDVPGKDVPDQDGLEQDGIAADPEAEPTPREGAGGAP